MKFLKHTILLVFILINSNIYSQNIEQKGFVVEQVSLPDGNISIYTCFDNYLTIQNNGKQILKIELKPEVLYRIDSLIKSVDIENMDSSFYSGAIDGISWTFTFKGYSKNDKQVVFDNYFNKDFHELLECLNSDIPIEKQYVSFKNGFITNINSESDSIIHILPDFCLEEINLPANYKSYRITCYKKGYFPTSDIDSINVCDCRIYPKKGSGNKKRNYWRYTRLEDGQWRKEYYNNQNNVIDIYIIQDVLPYEFVKIKRYSNKGDIPSIVVYKYYMTKRKK